MAWYVSAFLAVVAFCAVAYAALGLKNLFAPKRTEQAVVRKRYTEEFPMSVGLVRRNRKERYLEFETGEGKHVCLAVGEELYGQCPVGTKGMLTRRGELLVDFVPQHMPEG